VGYPIVDLRACSRPAWMPPSASRLRGLGPVDYVRALEEVLIRTAAEFGLPCRRIAGLTGVWTQAEPARKLAAIGVHVSRGVTSHGFAFNVAPDLGGFDYIVPCGIRDRGVTSLQQELGTSPSLAEVRTVVLRQFGFVFGRQVLRLESPEPLLQHEEEHTAQAPSGGSFVGR
jgi:lipoyl(octanoyl) transferase